MCLLGFLCGAAVVQIALYGLYGQSAGQSCSS